MKKQIIFALTVLLILSALPAASAFSPAPDYTGVAGITVWFYNSAGWGNVSAYVWGEQGEALGAWPGTEAAQDGASRWWSVTVDAPPPFNLIFNNGGSSQAGGVYIEDDIAVCATVKADGLFGSREEAEASIADTAGTPINARNTVWFFNSGGWPEVYAYVYGTILSDPLGPWPGSLAVRDGTAAWYSIEVPVELPFNIIFNDGSDTNKATSYIRDTVDIYLTVTDDVIYGSRAAAEADITDITPIPDTPDAPPLPDETPSGDNTPDNMAATPDSSNSPPPAPDGNSGPKTLLIVVFIIAGVVAVCLTVAIVITARRKGGR
jgi:hypothetical protein